MNKSPKENDLDSFVQAYIRNQMVFMKFLNFLKVIRNFIRCGKEVEQLCADVEYA